ncbi:phage tail tape measure protein [Tianweitania populi]|uniref:Phage tail tape measure protein domain-containing protein n=1 Tax=Tianweitania populi TaxID=1607949 RepID=A0A8J3DWK9_9HYPH|nr:phage tail tape measure protein [Tianweitania populi]GHD07690.1 hypothetical protein GCM10016234_06390 [Tianweitania populi]
MASKTNTATLRLQLEDLMSGPAKSASGSLRGLDGVIKAMGKSGAPGMQRLVKQMEHLKGKAGALEKFTDARRGLKELWQEIRAGKSHLRQLEQGMAGVAKPTAKMKAELRSAQSSVKNLTSTFRDQVAAARSAETALKKYSLNGRTAITSSQQRTRNEIAKTIREMRRLEQEHRRLPPGGGSGARDIMAAVGGGAAAAYTKRAAERSFAIGIEFNQEAEYQAVLGSFTPEGRAQLNAQANAIGKDTRFSDTDVVRAQTSILQGGIRDPKTIMDLTDKVTNYALAMKVTLEEAAETVRGAALSKRVKLSDAKAIGDFVDSLVWMAKNGGMNDEDVRQYMKYGGASTTGAGLPDAYSSAMAMLLKRSGVRGDEAGVFARSASSKLVAPTNKGRKALYAMGLDYNDYTTMPDSWNDVGIGKMMKNEFGVRLTPEMREEINQILNQEEFTDSDTGETRSVASDSGEFVARLSDVLTPLFGEKMSGADAKALSKALGDYHKMSVESVDVVGLFRAIMSNPDTSLAKLNAYFTDKQGSRANMIAQQFPLFEQLLQTMQNVPQGEAARIGTEANKGVYGDFTRMTGAWENALLKVSQDFEFATRPVIRTIDSVLTGFTNLDQGTRQLTAAVVTAGGALGGLAAMGATGRIVGRLLGGAGGGVGSAAAGGAAAAGAARGALGRLGTAGLYMAPLLSSGRLDAAKEAGVAKALQAQRKPPEVAQQDKAVSTGRDQLSQITLGWPRAAEEAMMRYQQTLQRGGDKAEAEAAAIAAEIQQLLSVTGHPDVDTSRLQAALGFARQVAAALSGGRVSATPPSTSSAGNSLPFGGPRAAGGPVQSGKAYVVGEDGPEVLTPGRSGHITPNHALAGVTVNIHAPITIHGGGEPGLEGALRKLEYRLTRSSQIVYGRLKPYGDN